MMLTPQDNDSSTDDTTLATTQATTTRSPTALGRRGFLRTGLAAGTVAAVAPTVTAQESPYGGWFADTDNYDGTVDGTGQETVTVSVGAGSSGLVFESAAIAIDPGTTVVWEWTGEGGGHNVAAEDGSFESETVSEAGHTFEYTFSDDTDGEIFKYACVPHQALGMVGAVAVGDAVTPDADTGTSAGGGDTGGTTDGASGGGGGDESTTGGGLSTEGQLTMVGGALSVALLSPAIFGLVLKLIYEDDRQTDQPAPPQ